MTRPAVIFKIVPTEEWKAAQAAFIYHGSAHDRQDGFLHFSTASQLEETLRRYYANSGAVVIAAVKTDSLGDALKYEYSTSRGEDFPHLYGPLRLIYEPIEKATVLSELIIRFEPLLDNGPLANWLTELRIVSS